jgi:hypothetical protein
MAPQTPIGRMTLRKNAPGDGQKPRIRLWTLGTPAEGTTANKLFAHYLRVFENVDRWDSKKAELKSNPELTDIGRQRQALDFGFGAIMPDNLQARRTLAKAKREVATMRSKLELPKGDPALERARERIQDLMRGMDDKSREAFRKKHEHNPEVRQAIVSALPEMTGISDVVHARLTKEVLDEANRPALENIEYLDRAIEIAASALEEGKNEIQREAIAVDPAYSDVDRFEARAIEAAKLEDQPWLKVHNENGAEILRVFDWNEETKSGGWKIPTSEQIENGVVAQTKDEFDRLKTAAPLGAFGIGDEGRKARAEFVAEHGIDVYLNRGKAA